MRIVCLLAISFVIGGAQSALALKAPGGGTPSCNGTLTCTVNGICTCKSSAASGGSRAKQTNAPVRSFSAPEHRSGKH